MCCEILIDRRLIQYKPERTVRKANHKKKRFDIGLKPTSRFREEIPKPPPRSNLSRLLDLKSGHIHYRSRLENLDLNSESLWEPKALWDHSFLQPSVQGEPCADVPGAGQHFFHQSSVPHPHAHPHVLRPCGFCAGTFHLSRALPITEKSLGLEMVPASILTALFEDSVLCCTAHWG